MAETRKSYGEGCIAAHALDLIGDRWALLVVRELMLGPKRFGGIRAALPGIATNMLTRRLEDMERGGILVRRTLPAPASAQVYDLTPAGRDLWPVLRELCRWGGAMPGHDPHLPISPTALMLSMRATFAPARAAGLRLTAGFDMQGEGFVMTLDDGALAVRRDDPGAAELGLSGRANDMAAAVYGPRPLAEAVAAGRVALTGDGARGQAFVDCFALAPA